MTDAIRAVEESGVVPVITPPDVERALSLAEALLLGDIPVVEFTLRNPFGIQAVAAVKKRWGKQLVTGAGTVLNCGQVDEAAQAGADFIVTPGFDQPVVEYCLRIGIPVIPGCVTASEVSQAVSLGLSVLKFFPAETSGGLAAIRSLAAPFPIRFLPTGGLTRNNIGAYLSAREVLACGGSFMAPSGMVAAGDFEGITALCRQVRDISLGFQLAHAGVNCENREQALLDSRFVQDAFGCPVKEGRSSVFAGQAVEFMKTPAFGKNGHIGFTTSSMTRAVAYFRRRGILLREDSAKYDDKGRLASIYLAKEISGFAFHIMQA